MAEVVVYSSILASTSSALNILIAIKHRLGGGSVTLAEQASKCADLVDEIRKLLEVQNEDVQLPQNTSEILTALNRHRDEFDATLKNLQKMNQRITSTHPTDRTKKFILAQGWAKNMAAIYTNLARVRQDILDIVSNCDESQFVVLKGEEIAVIDVTKNEEPEGIEQQAESEIGSGTLNYVDRIIMAMVKLTDANKTALIRYGNLDKLSLPDALYQASFRVDPTDKMCSIQLMQHSAELLHPEARNQMKMIKPSDAHQLDSGRPVNRSAVRGVRTDFVWFSIRRNMLHSAYAAFSRARSP